MNSRIRKSYIKQQDQADCGIACLYTLIKYFGGTSSFEELRNLSGTRKDGTTMLGLIEAARNKGLSAEGYRIIDCSELFKLSQPAILHIEFQNKFRHFVIYWPKESNESKILITDPVRGILRITKEELYSLWKSETLVVIEPSENFKKECNEKSLKNKWLYQIIAFDFPILSACLFLGLIISVLSLTSTIFTQKLIDSILPSDDKPRLAITLSIFFLLLLVKFLLSYLRGNLLFKQSASFNNRIINWFYDKVINLPKSFLDNRTTGDFINRVNDSRRIQSTISVVLGSIVIDLLLMIIAIIFISFYSWEIICVLLIAITISIILTSIFKSKIIVSQKEYFRIYSDVESNFIDTFKGIAEIKVFNKQLSFQTQTKNLYNKLQYNYLKLSGLNLRFSTISEFSNTMLTVVVIVITSDMFFANELKLGELISILAMSNIVLPTFSRVSISYMQVQEALIAFDRMYEFTSLKGENEGSELIIEEIKLNFIQLKNVSFKFAGHKNILSDISFNFNRGEITCLYGASGKGKSTLLQILQKLQASYDGKIIINEDIDFKSIEISQWRSLLGSVNQAPKVFKGSLLFNITLDNDPIKLSSAISFCQSHGFSKYINEIPNGYNCIIGEGGIKLSGGQIQLLCIARALFINPQLLLLDEPTSAMDSEMENFVLSLIKSVKKDKLILIISHQHSIIEECDRIIKI